MPWLEHYAQVSESDSCSAPTRAQDSHPHAKRINGLLPACVDHPAQPAISLEGHVESCDDDHHKHYITVKSSLFVRTLCSMQQDGCCEGLLVLLEGMLSPGVLLNYTEKAGLSRSPPPPAGHRNRPRSAPHCPCTSEYGLTETFKAFGPEQTPMQQSRLCPAAAKDEAGNTRYEHGNEAGDGETSIRRDRVAF